MERPPLRRLTRQFRTLRQKPATLPCGGLSPSSRPNTRLARKRPTRANVAGLRRKLGDARRGVDLEAEHDMVRGAGVWNPLLVARNLRLGSELVAGECDRPLESRFLVLGIDWRFVELLDVQQLLAFPIPRLFSRTLYYKRELRSFAGL